VQGDGPGGTDHRRFREPKLARRKVGVAKRKKKTKGKEKNSAKTGGGKPFKKLSKITMEEKHLAFLEKSKAKRGSRGRKTKTAHAIARPPIKRKKKKEWVARNLVAGETGVE